MFYAQKTIRTLALAGLAALAVGCGKKNGNAPASLTDTLANTPYGGAGGCIFLSQQIGFTANNVQLGNGYLQAMQVQVGGGGVGGNGITLQSRGSSTGGHIAITFSQQGGGNPYGGGNGGYGNTQTYGSGVLQISQLMANYIRSSMGYYGNGGGYGGGNGYGNFPPPGGYTYQEPCVRSMDIALFTDFNQGLVYGSAPYGVQVRVVNANVQGQGQEIPFILEF